MDELKLLHDIKSLGTKFDMITDEMTLSDLNNQTEVLDDLLTILKDSQVLLEKIQIHRDSL